jgi:hypothetical protein
MSSFDVKMETEGKTYHVVNMNYSVNRDFDYTGRPASQLKNSFLDLDLEVPDGDAMFFKWLCQNEVHDGSIRFNKIDQESRHIEFKYEKAYCLTYKQLYASGPKSLVVSLRLSAQKLTMTSGGEEHMHEFFPAV